MEISFSSLSLSFDRAIYSGQQASYSYNWDEYTNEISKMALLPFPVLMATSSLPAPRSMQPLYTIPDSPVMQNTLVKSFHDSMSTHLDQQPSLAGRGALETACAWPQVSVAAPH